MRLPAAPVAEFVQNATEVVAGETVTTDATNTSCDATPCTKNWGVSSAGLRGEVGGLLVGWGLSMLDLAPGMPTSHRFCAAYVSSHTPLDFHGSLLPQLVCPNGYNATATGNIVDWTTGANGTRIPMVRGGPALARPACCFACTAPGLRCQKPCLARRPNRNVCWPVVATLRRPRLQLNSTHVAVAASLARRRLSFAS